MGDKGVSTELEIYGNIKRLLCIESLNYSKNFAKPSQKNYLMIFFEA